jgi:2'-5' RNA ligase
MRVRLSCARCWGTPADGIYLGVDDTRGDIDRVRESLGVLDPPGAPYVPHVTLLHSQTVTASRLREAWGQLANWALDATVVLNGICVVELRGTEWQVIAQVTLMSD